MRDGVKIAIDVYRPDATERLPALLAFSIYNKDKEGIELDNLQYQYQATSVPEPMTLVLLGPSLLGLAASV